MFTKNKVSDTEFYQLIATLRSYLPHPGIEERISRIATAGPIRASKAMGSPHPIVRAAARLLSGCRQRSIGEAIIAAIEAVEVNGDALTPAQRNSARNAIDSLASKQRRPYNGLNPTAAAIKKAIDEKPGQSARDLSKIKDVNVTEETVRRNISKKLSPLGYFNAGGKAGYFPPT